MKFFYVYILQSESSGKHFYVGFTEDLQDRLKTHNAGQVPHTINPELRSDRPKVAATPRRHRVIATPPSHFFRQRQIAAATGDEGVACTFPVHLAETRQAIFKTGLPFP
jgi:hypothetical protein